MHNKFHPVTFDGIRLEILSGKALVTIVFIIIPLCYMTLSTVTKFLIMFFKTDFYVSPLFGTSLPLPIPPVPLILILFVFAVIPAVFPTQKFFKKRGFENAIIEYQYLKKILYISIFTLVVSIGIYYYLNSEVSNIGNSLLKQDKSLNQSSAKLTPYLQKITPQIQAVYKRGGLVSELDKTASNIEKQDKQSYILFTKFGEELVSKLNYMFPFAVFAVPVYELLFMIPIVPVSIIIKLLLEHARREFRLYYAKGCFKIASKEATHELDKAKYFRMGLLWYNSFLNKTTGLRINDIMKIYSKVITHSPSDRNKSIALISESFDEPDPLTPLQYLSAFIADSEMAQALTKEPLMTTIKESSALLIPIITVIITIITTFILPKPQH